MSQFSKLLNQRVRSPQKAEEIYHKSTRYQAVQMASNRKLRTELEKQQIHILDARQSSLPSILRPIQQQIIIPERIQICEQVVHEDVDADLKVMLHYVKNQRKEFQDLDLDNTK
ncbi:hypothetical protein SS50377_27496 [Spironucleus salmonicida]|uniref:Uncharacterized protein n=1 Tax=Spironucleus salmonicida TaxID=348837 RepID=A0A9P8LN65_9EUKA|nr:hypothetical protein SS50377_27496 [Spironucleus salmonicida]